MERTIIIETLNQAVKALNDNDIELASQKCLQILKEHPEESQALQLLGLIRMQQKKYDQAEELIKKSIQQNPKEASYHNNLATLYELQNKQDNAAKSYEQALNLNSKFKNAKLAHYNLGIREEQKQNHSQALKHYEQAIRLDENFHDAKFNKSLILLKMGDYKQGWKDYASRHKKQNPTDPRKINRQEWQGQDLKGKTILIITEQGAGDNIQFIRYAKLLAEKEKPKKIILECNPELHELIKENQEINEYVKKENSTDLIIKLRIDYYAHLMDLPRIFETTPNNTPKKTPYIKVNQEIKKKYEKHFDKKKFNVGIVWSGNPEQPTNKERSTSPEMFEGITKINGIKVFSLQKNATEEQLEKLKQLRIKNLAGKTNNFSETAGMLQNLDLIISVDTSIAHLAGAIGKPVWTLLSNNSDWRWLENRKDTPWYPTMKLYRQKKDGEWKEAIENIREELEKKLKN